MAEKFKDLSESFVLRDFCKERHNTIEERVRKMEERAKHMEDMIHNFNLCIKKKFNKLYVMVIGILTAIITTLITVIVK